MLGACWGFCRDYLADYKWKGGFMLGSIRLILRQRFSSSKTYLKDCHRQVILHCFLNSQSMLTTKRPYNERLIVVRAPSSSEVPDILLNQPLLTARPTGSVREINNPQSQISFWNIYNNSSACASKFSVLHYWAVSYAENYKGVRKKDGKIQSSSQDPFSDALESA